MPLGRAIAAIILLAILLIGIVAAHAPGGAVAIIGIFVFIGVIRIGLLTSRKR